MTKGNLAAVEFLLQHGADIELKNSTGRTPLQGLIYPPFFIERYGDPVPGAKFLLDHGADVNTLSDEGKTALDIAIEQDNEAVAELLREHGGMRAEEIDS